MTDNKQCIICGEEPYIWWEDAARYGVNPCYLCFVCGNTQIKNILPKIEAIQHKMKEQSGMKRGFALLTAFVLAKRRLR